MFFGNRCADYAISFRAIPAARDPDAVHLSSSFTEVRPRYRRALGFARYEDKRVRVQRAGKAGPVVAFAHSSLWVHGVDPLPVGVVPVVRDRREWVRCSQGPLLVARV